MHRRWSAVCELELASTYHICFNDVCHPSRRAPVPFDFPTASKRQELMDLMHDALDEYEAGGSDLAALVHDIDTLIPDLETVADAGWIAGVKDQSRRLGIVKEESARLHSWQLPELGNVVAGAAVCELRRLLEA